MVKYKRMSVKLFGLILIVSVLASFQTAAQNIQLNHIALYVTDLDRSTRFYREVVGLDTIANPFNDGKHTWFTIGPKSHLHIIEGASTTVKQDKNSHLCFSVPSVEIFISVLKKNNISFESWTGEKMKVTLRVDGVQQIYFKDPDGYWIEINDAKD